MKRKIFFSTLISFSASVCFFAQTEKEKKEIVKNYDHKTLSTLFEQFSQQAKADKENVLAYAKRNKLPSIKEEKDGKTNELIRIDEDGTFIYYTTDNVAAARSTRTNHLNTGGSLGLNLDGQNMIVGVWDGGAVRNNHVEFENRVIPRDNAIFDVIMGSNHATHVAGTIAARGLRAEAKGMAPESTINSYDWNNDIAEMTAGAANALLLSNHSYGLRSENLPDWYFGAYIRESRDWDNILFNAPLYLAVKAAGNDGRNLYTDNNGVQQLINENPMGGATNDYDKLTAAATAKNTLVVANAQDANVADNGDFINVDINASSSQGPTDDLRIKPDIAGNGTGVISPVAFNERRPSTNFYNNYTGTSMASPNVTGSLALIQQHHRNILGRYMLGAELKGLALHTADDAGLPGPDAMFGWGLLNTKKMAETINNLNGTALISNRTLRNNGREVVEIESDGVNPIIASISWYDRPGEIQTAGELNINISRLVNDLDIRIVGNNGQTFFPWTLTSRSTNSRQDNSKDNFERIDAGVLPVGKYSVIVNHKRNLTGGLQNYTLIITGLNNLPAQAEIKQANIANNENLLKIYPNPAKNEINVLINIKDQKTTIKIFDTSGRQITSYDGVNGENKLDISSLEAGSYVLSVDTKDEKLVKRFIKH